ncbi:MAG: hypothetical protein AA908_00050 [Chlorobi bacterium NICIL-2]|nr:MAG: hypothetical protein AA908_00050 [Chlorobi bacterium NICIL-2]
MLDNLDIVIMAAEVKHYPMAIENRLELLDEQLRIPVESIRAEWMVPDDNFHRCSGHCKRTIEPPELPPPA